MNYEYIQLVFAFGDLTALNRLSSAGWRVVHVEPCEMNHKGNRVALLERKVQP